MRKELQAELPCHRYPMPALSIEKENQTMTDYILNKVVLKNGDSLDIVESSTLPLPERLMYKVEHEKEKIIIRRDVEKMIIPVDYILFASSIPLDITYEDFEDEI